jgi:membrane-bound lytic murein transglycosylase B
MIFAISLLVVGYLVLAETRAAVEPNNEAFSSVKKRLITDGFDPTKINRLYSRPQVFFEADGVTILFTYKEAQVDYGQFANNWSIRKAKQYMQKYKDDLIRTEKAFGVDRKIITAIMLVETGLGALMDPVVRDRFWDLIPDSKKISRKKFEKKAAARSKWAYKELKAFLKYASREGFDPASIPGSFAGAVGVAQFMPTSILAYGKDGNNDGTVDMLNHVDSMASIANFLKSHGWRSGQSRKKAEKVIFHYNHSTYYVDTILKISRRLKS